MRPPVFAGPMLRQRSALNSAGSKAAGESPRARAAPAETISTTIGDRTSARTRGIRGSIGLESRAMHAGESTWREAFGRAAVARLKPSRDNLQKIALTDAAVTYARGRPRAAEMHAAVVAHRAHRAVRRAP